ncbi:hypothetical protein DACRYDRAFT_23341 [Dacryopinax primogenitus]|uniref:Uncharacterized protein n=1 Tax=Dacryopinax primogenitus (strain DJM 731) TaxID=1858805 RepID=M5G3M7_DACPD|nr:uncharacterized protein DACRYDRAFT_23341 [Dacryopinax primogenitus]EJU00462.1 hypothetical protein DACRYDRAFT_23341 [Dacryopinax primogenitus]
MVLKQGGDMGRNDLEIAIDSILQSVFTARAVTAIHDGAGPLGTLLAPEWSIDPLATVDSGTQTTQLYALLKRLENTLRQAQNTVDVMPQLLVQLQSVGDRFAILRSTWTSIEEGVRTSLEQCASWKKSNVLTPELLASVAGEWLRYEESLEEYVTRLTGSLSPRSIAAFALTVSPPSNVVLELSKKRVARVMSVAGELKSATSEPYLPAFDEILNDPQIALLFYPDSDARRLSTTMALMSASTEEQLLNALRAPRVSLTCKRQTLSNTADQYQATARIMDGFYPEGAVDARKLSANITDVVLPKLGDAIAFYMEFTTQQINALSGSATKDSLEHLQHERAEEAKKGNEKALAAQNDVLTLKNNSVLAYNKLVSKSNEIQAEIDQSRRTLQEKKNELAKYDWVKWWPLPPGIGLLIKVLVEEITHTESDINNLERNIGQYEQAKRQMEAVRATEDSYVNTIVSVTTSWASLTQETNDLAGLLQIIADLPVTIDSLIVDARNSWLTLSAELQQW